MRLRDHLRQFDGNFWRYLGSYSLFWFGVFIFAELYALYMRELGYGVVVLGNASVALNLGSIAGTIPAVFLMRRLGLARTTAVSFAGASLASAVRLWHDHALAVYGGAFAAGFFFAVAAVGIAVIVSRLTTPGNRAVGFGWFFAVSIGAGFLGDAVGGELPGLFARHFGLPQGADAMLVAALVACAVSLASAAPAAGLRFPSVPVQGRAMNIPREPAVARILIAVCVWNFAVGLFAPFYAVYFSNWLHEPVSAIGLDLAGGQVVGALFVAFAPAVVAARGPVTGARFMMFFAGACALFLAVAASPLTAGVGYAAYMGFVAMAQVPLQTLLMNRVRTDEQSGASMLAALVGFCAVAAGGFVGGELISSFGFGPLLVLAGAMSMLAALVFVVLVRTDPHEGEGGVAVPAGGA